MARLSDLILGFVGNIGAGKTTLIDAAQQEDHYPILLSTLDDNPHATRTITSLREDVDRELVGKFYQDPKRYAFAAQINFLNARLKRETVIEQTPGIICVDRPIEEDYKIFGFAQRILNNMTSEEFQVYANTFHLMTARFNLPDVYIYLKSDIPTLQRNIKQRGIPQEQGLVSDPSYLATLQPLYDKFMAEAERPVITIDATKFQTNNHLDQNYINASLQHIAFEIKKLDLPKTTKNFGRWLSMNPAEAVLACAELEDRLATYLSKEPKYITVAANIGLGKTTTTRILSRRLNVSGAYELDKKHDLINDTLLTKFLTDMPKYCHALQQHFAQKRLELRRTAKEQSPNHSIIEDRSPEEDPAIFHKLFKTRGFLTPEQVDSLEAEALSAYKTAIPSDIMIHLHGPAELSHARKIMRGREEEKSAWSLSDLTELARLYNELPQKIHHYGLHQGPVLSFDVRHFDITNEIHRGYMYEEMLRSLHQNADS